MTSKISRRNFIKKSSILGLGSYVGWLLLSKTSLGSAFEGHSDISVFTGTDHFNGTRKAIDALGGMSKFVGEGQKVGLLINSDFTDRGAYVDPDIPLAVIDECIKAGAKEFVCLQSVKEEYWQRSENFNTMADRMLAVKNVGTNVFPAKFNEEDFHVVGKISGAKLLENVELVKEIDDCDVFINIAIGKHHATTLYTGAIKNMMGLCTRKTNVHMHLGSGTKNDPEHLGQCLADINQYRRPDLVIVDSTYFITTNGPVGPGEIKNPEKIVAGTDITAVDAYCSEILGYVPQDILHIVRAHESGLGEIDYSLLKIKEV